MQILYSLPLALFSAKEKMGLEGIYCICVCARARLFTYLCVFGSCVAENTVNTSLFLEYMYNTYIV